MPFATPVTTPDDVPTVARDVLLLVHVPPVLALVNVAVVGPPPPHIAAAPVMADGFGLTVNTPVIWQPLGAI